MARLEYDTPMGIRVIELDELESGVLKIGRASRSDIHIDDGDVSRKHAYIERVGDAWRIIDGSLNGTLVNGRPVQESRMLRDGDTITIGKATFRYREQEDETGESTRPVEPAPPLTPKEHEVLVELCRPYFEGAVFTEPPSVREIGDAMFVGENAVKAHLDHLYEKFRIDAGPRRRSRLGQQAIHRHAVTSEDYPTPAEDGEGHGD
ncbi:MAG TPA: FHA domain-containing protein [Acidimicrobiales bacterium]|nr:FHA domain-containing protein [Acidimicrobiales bacterium]